MASITTTNYNTADWNTALWAKLSKDYGIRLGNLQKKLEGDLPELETSKLRGRIAEIRRLLALSKDVLLTFDAPPSIYE